MAYTVQEWMFWLQVMLCLVSVMLTSLSVIIIAAWQVQQYAITWMTAGICQTNGAAVSWFSGVEPLKFCWITFVLCSLESEGSAVKDIKVVNPGRDFLMAIVIVTSVLCYNSQTKQVVQSAESTKEVVSTTVQTYPSPREGMSASVLKAMSSEMRTRSRVMVNVTKSPPSSSTAVAGSSSQNLYYCLSQMFMLSDVDECRAWGHKCPQLCQNVKGSHKCQCAEGFADLTSGRGTLCKASGRQQFHCCSPSHYYKEFTKHKKQTSCSHTYWFSVPPAQARILSCFLLRDMKSASMSHHLRNSSTQTWSLLGVASKPWTLTPRES